jgi:hypothetical protein
MRAGLSGNAAVTMVAVLACSTALAQVQVRAPGVHVGVARTPWFSDPAIRRELKLNDTQYERLTRDYSQAWETYNKNFAELKKDLTEEQQRKQMQELSNSFYGTFNKGVDEVFADPVARSRYNRLYWQYRGYSAFDDPVIEKKLDLTAEQRAAIRRYEAEYDQQLRDMRRDYAKDRAGVTKRYGTWWQQTRDRINETLTPQQRTTWAEFVGDPYDFPVTAYFGE